MINKFSDGTPITPYLASAYAECFCEGEGASQLDQIRAWCFLIGTKLVYQLQGWYGRQAQNLIEQGIVSPSGDLLVDEEMFI